MSEEHDRATSRLGIAAIVLCVFVVMFVSQLGGGPNTGGVFPVPLLVIGLLGMPISGIFVIFYAYEFFSLRKDEAKNKKDRKDA
jgi:hypothetical protein